MDIVQYNSIYFNILIFLQHFNSIHITECQKSECQKTECQKISNYKIESSRLTKLSMETFNFAIAYINVFCTIYTGALCTCVPPFVASPTSQTYM